MNCYKRSLTVIIPAIISYYLFWEKQIDLMSVRGKRALVTGASSGIGEQIAYKYAKLGAKLIITARRSEKLENVARNCQELGAETVHFVPADMTVSEDRKKLLSVVNNVFGGLDFLILNHGVMRYAWWKNAPDNVTVLQDMMNVNFYSFVHLTTSLLDHLQESRGYIAVVSSMGGKFGVPGMTQYSANKHALQGFFASLRQELRFKQTGVSVTLAVYGPVDSLRAIQLNEDIKKPLDFLTIAGTTEEAANVLVQGVLARDYEVYFPALSSLVVLLNRVAPKFVEDSIIDFMSEYP